MSDRCARCLAWRPLLVGAVVRGGADRSGDDGRRARCGGDGRSRCVPHPGEAGVADGSDRDPAWGLGFGLVVLPLIPPGYWLSRSLNWKGMKGTKSMKNGDCIWHPG